jgi:hypothetical protein
VLCHSPRAKPALHACHIGPSRSFGPWLTCDIMRHCTSHGPHGRECPRPVLPRSTGLPLCVWNNDGRPGDADRGCRRKFPSSGARTVLRCQAASRHGQSTIQRAFETCHKLIANKTNPHTDSLVMFSVSTPDILTVRPGGRMHGLPSCTSHSDTPHRIGPHRRRDRTCRPASRRANDLGYSIR